MSKNSIFNLCKIFMVLLILLLAKPSMTAQRPQKPVLHGRHWIAITGKPLGATAGAK